MVVVLSKTISLCYPPKQILLLGRIKKKHGICKIMCGWLAEPKNRSYHRASGEVEMRGPNQKLNSISVSAISSPCVSVST